MNDKQFKYYAFISYCSADEKWAKWLHRHLENYHIPTRLCTEYPTLPKKIRPVFWYKVDLSGTKLKSSLEKELAASNYLIVVCSPDSAKSDWVNDEVISFINKDGGQRIIPVIVAGEPKSGNPRTECFPPALRDLSREDEIRGISIPQAGKYHALVDIVATMFNVRFDSLWQRHRRRMIRNRIIASILAIAAIIFGVFAFNYFRTTRSYYANYEFCLGMPVGIGPLKKSELKSVLSHYVFESSRGKLRRVYLSNPFGHPMNENSSWSQLRGAILDLAYEGDKLSSISFSDCNSKPLYKFVYSDDYTRADIKDAETGDAASLFKSSSSTFENMAGEGILDLNNVFQNTKSQVARYAYDYDSDGYIAKIHFKRYNGSNETGYDDNGICGIEYERDSQHRVTKKRYLDENGEYMADKIGCAGVEYVYNDKGFAIYERFFDLDGNNRMTDMGYAISKLEYDYPAHKIVETHFGPDGKPIMTIANYQSAIFEIKGDTLITSYFDTEERPTLMSFQQRNIGLFHKSKSIFDKKGNNIEISFYDTDGKPCYDITRVHKIINEYDDKGRCIKCISFNTEGERQLNIFQISEACFTYVDDTNNIESIEFFRQPGIRANTMGISRRVFAYSGNKIVKSACYDSNDTPIYSSVNLGAHIAMLDYDDFGNVSDIWLKDIRGTTEAFPDNTPTHIKASYNNGNCVKLQFLNKHGRPVTLPYGYSTMTMEFDKKGHRTATEFLDTLGLPASHPSLQYSRIESEYSDHGNVVITRSLDHNHKPIICFDGWAMKKEEFKDNLLTRITCFGTKDEPILAKNIDAHAKEFEYDQSRRLISEKYFGLDNQPTLTGMGTHETRYKYNSNGNLVEIAFYDTLGQPVNSIHNYHKKIISYDNRHNPVEERFLDKKNKLTENYEVGYAYSVAKYNPQGQILSIAYYGADSQPVNNAKGIHLTLNHYNQSGDLILFANLDKDMKPVSQLINNDYFAIAFNLFDENGLARGGITYGENFDEIKLVIPLFKNGMRQGVLTRNNIFSVKLQLPDGTEQNLNILSKSAADRKYFAMLDSISDASLIEVKRLIEEAR